jgi:two-component sensor histidine kinase
MPEIPESRRREIDQLLRQVAAGTSGAHQLVSLDHDELRNLVEALPVAILISTDGDCSQIWGNAAARELFRLPEGRNFSRTAPANELPPFEVYANGEPARPEDLPLQRAARTGQPVAKSECEIRFLSGRRIFIAGHSIPIRNTAGELCGSLGAFLDVTPERQEVETSAMISKEMSHRLRNTIALIQFISRSSLEPLIGPAAYATYEHRLVSLANYQDLLHRDSWRGAQLAKIVDLATAGLGAGTALQISASGPDVSVSDPIALALSMILHELAINAVKYGALSVPGGKVQVTWDFVSCAEASSIQLRWSELGGPPVEKPTMTGCGTSMMTAAARALPCGQLDRDFTPTGLRATLTFANQEDGPASRHAQ